MFIWSSFFQLFHSFTLMKCINVALYAIVFVYSNLYMWRREVNEAKDVHVAFAVMTIFEVLNEISRNLAGYLHVPGPLLKDIGFMLIPEFHNKLLSRVG